MTPDQYQATHNLTDAQFCRILNESRPSPADPPIFEHRLARLKSGKSRPTILDLYMLQAATDDLCDSYKSYMLIPNRYFTGVRMVPIIIDIHSAQRRR